MIKLSFLLKYILKRCHILLNELLTKSNPYLFLKDIVKIEKLIKQVSFKKIY